MDVFPVTFSLLLLGNCNEIVTDIPAKFDYTILGFPSSWVAFGTLCSYETIHNDPFERM